MAQCCVAAYVAGVRPFVGITHYRVEIKGEMFMLGMTYFTLLFTEYVPDEETRYTVGYVMVFLFLTVVAFDLILICFSLLRTIYLILRRFKCIKSKRQANKLQIG